jgi:CMP-N,N'-diacetyllegionaminic acid synthase
MIDKFDNVLFLIMARGGSKGIPGKNIKPLAGKPLLYYSIDIARNFVGDNNICLSTDSIEIKNKAEEYGLKVPFIRPNELATDEADSYFVELHALDYYEKIGKKIDVLVVLQTTSPFRKIEDVQRALDLYSISCDMVVSVVESKSNPYYNLFEENSTGFLGKSKPGDYIRRQDCPTVYEFNGAIYVVNVESLKQMPEYKFQKIKKIVMDEFSSVDLDNSIDWAWAEFLINNKVVEIKNNVRID